MQTSLFLAQLMGPAFVVMGVGMLINRDGYRAMAQEFLASRALIYLAGLLALVPGLAIVLVHNVWAFDWRLIITLFGWLAVIGGAIRIAAPAQVQRVGAAILGREGAMAVAGIVMILLGLVLSWFGYGA